MAPLSTTHRLTLPQPKMDVKKLSKVYKQVVLSNRPIVTAPPIPV